MQSTPAIPILEEKNISKPMQVDAEQEMPLTIPISTPTSTTGEITPAKDSIDAPQLGDTQAGTGETDQQENHLIGIDPYIGTKKKREFERNLRIEIGTKAQ